MAISVGAGPIPAVLEENRAMLNLYRPADQNRIQREALRRALANHRSKNIARRFGRWVKGAPLNYQWSKRGRPLVSSGTMARTVYTGTIRTSTRGGVLSGTMTLPPGHPLPTGNPGRGWPKNAKPTPYRNEIQRVLASVTQREVIEMAELISRHMLGIFSRSNVARRRPRGGGERRRRLTTNQRAQFRARQARAGTRG